MELQMERLHKQAVDAALDNNWDKAIRLNKEIVAVENENVDACLGLAFAYLQKGDLAEAKKYYRKALKYDATNQIARNNLEKITILSKKGDLPEKFNKRDVSLDPNTFINVRGKTKVVTLLNIGQSDVLVKLKIGEKVFLKLKKRRIEVRNKKEEYIGCLPDDISKRLIYFLEAKSKYTSFVKEATKNSVDIFIREDKRGKKVLNYESFPDNIQDDLKKFINKMDDDKDDHEDDYMHHEDDEDDEIVEDIEELANEVDETKDRFDDLNVGVDDYEE
ncbi:hypothetical protein A3H80_01110 [Candidatus Roizmanbacteria bacterium RIFCSPLOWO2_02_FULL_37_19]|uniref:Uncharacterized protein n=1 Tax=Candidatus Roizmanbacteria bacterium RIFCSPHIGHO2_02_FULL_37_24 TaxID=1802037 RepID=A0A1F7GVC9_9BACT|nr:MAG: hypothetical protein A2862_00685 [Candidatus Roizmanbacteria bacterium RIFCSPHIGHO2_01_FULL_38_41]OGK22536.1 MAG: hypothetical protein A3C24_05230 [Candidatus Roizmanbacteria bacterium RIFCSPHIGHO2_02_FULL_37_24]OGK33936.1 MAG: hypothetical protein A3E10_02015 [Candidatus Roizmanbacteria bacterium RIFCSPHIGHO2_12_FULL_37_23]OGK43646.1 MAG: hypothetical protein A2956_04050 [Candidatus Roizmanbacteria bacterium RIFCSPLOWO2_01_FULL_37_57]OGK54199.1 MAG: hypothetical protein A3H80_01110 [Ca